MDNVGNAELLQTGKLAKQNIILIYGASIG